MVQMSIPTATVHVDRSSRQYRWSNGAGSSKVYFKTFKGAVKAACRRGYDVKTMVDPMPAFLAADSTTRIVTNLTSGKLVRIPTNTPLCCDPSSETYWSM